MQKLSFILCMIFCISIGASSAYAEDGFDEPVLDVFEEYAVTDSVLIQCENFSITVKANKPYSDKLRYTSNQTDISFEIETAPKKGKVEITGTEGEFVYTPFEDQTGTDVFKFRISSGTEQSNIATCSVTILQDTQSTPTPEPEPVGFLYEDMTNHWANYAAVKMVENNIIKGERIGSKYYFYPDRLLTRIDVIQYLIAALGAENTQIDGDNTHIFTDSVNYPEYMNKAAYIAYKLGIIEGERYGEELYLNPYKNITRVEMMKMLDKAMNPKTRSDIELSFIDKHLIPDWAVQYVKNMVGYGIVQGDENNALKPMEDVSKAATVEMMYKMMKYNSENKTQSASARIKNNIYNTLMV